MVTRARSRDAQAPTADFGTRKRGQLGMLIPHRRWLSHSYRLESALQAMTGAERVQRSGTNRFAVAETKQDSTNRLAAADTEQD